MRMWQRHFRVQLALCFATAAMAAVGALAVRGSKVPVVLGDLVWEDLNRNGVQDKDEPGVNGVIVRAFRSDTGQLLTTQATRGDGGRDGVFSFSVEPPLVLYLEFDLPIDYQFTAPKQGGNAKLDSDANPLSGRTEWIRLDRGTAGGVEPDWDAGLVRKLFERGSPNAPDVAEATEGVSEAEPPRPEH